MIVKLITIFYQGNVKLKKEVLLKMEKNVFA